MPKRDGGLRPILDLRPINRALGKRPFRMLTLKQILAQIRPGDWFAYQYSVLPFGLTLAPHTFQSASVQYFPTQIEWKVHPQLSGRLADFSSVPGYAYQPHRLAAYSLGVPTAICQHAEEHSCPKSVHNISGSMFRLRRDDSPPLARSRGDESPPLVRLRGDEKGIPQGEWRLHPESVRMIWNRLRYGRAEVDLFATSENAHCPLFFTLTSRWPAARPYTFPPIKKCCHWCYASISATHRPEPALVPRLDGTAGGTTLADPRQEAYAIPGVRLGVALQPGTMEPSCVIASGVSEEMGALQSHMLGTLMKARTPSTRCLYASKWGVFVKWCGQTHIDPATCTVSCVLSFPQYRLDSGSLPSTLKSM